MTISKARKILGVLANDFSDDQVGKEINLVEFLVELMMILYKEEKGRYNEGRNA
ncbi:MAG TPA: hypothetical protein VLH94_02685 [Spirochaetia bacterium]|nr:hypothetical protein [Spirochaetia bacterium]